MPATVWEVGQKVPNIFPLEMRKTAGKNAEFFTFYIFVYTFQKKSGRFYGNSKFYILDLWKENFKSFSTMYSTLPPEVSIPKFLSLTFSHRNENGRKKKGVFS